VVNTFKARLEFALVSSSELITQPLHFHVRGRIEITHIIGTVGEDRDTFLSLLEVRVNKVSVRSPTISELLELGVSPVDPVSVPIWISESDE
jgi:hypothetical protein